MAESITESSLRWQGASRVQSEQMFVYSAVAATAAELPEWRPALAECYRPEDHPRFAETDTDAPELSEKFDAWAPPAGRPTLFRQSSCAHAAAHPL